MVLEEGYTFLLPIPVTHVRKFHPSPPPTKVSPWSTRSTVHHSHFTIRQSPIHHSPSLRRETLAARQSASLAFLTKFIAGDVYQQTWNGFRRKKKPSHGIGPNHSTRNIALIINPPGPPEKSDNSEEEFELVNIVLLTT